MAVLTLVHHGKNVARRKLEGPLLIGRGEECDVRVQDTKLSRRHCRLEPCTEGWVLVDLDSTNGTMLNGKRVKRELLSDGLTFNAGGLSMHFEVAQTLDDQVLEMLNDTSPDAALDIPQESIAGEEFEIAAELESPAAPPPAPQQAAPQTSTIPVESSASSAVPAPNMRGKNLWVEAAAIADTRAATKRVGRDASSTKQQTRLIESLKQRIFALWPRLDDSAEQAPWHRRRIPLPTAVIVVVIVAGCLYGLTNYGSRVSANNKPLVHHHTTKWTD